MLYICGAIAGLLTGALNIAFFCRKRRISTCIHLLIRDAVFVNLVSLGIMQFILRLPNVFSPELHGPYYPLKYFALTLLVGLVCLAVEGVLDGFFVFERTVPRHRGRAWGVRILSVVLFLLGAATLTATFWAKETMGDLTPDQMLINILSPVTGTGEGVASTILEGPVFQTMLMTAVFCLFALSPRKIMYQGNKKLRTVLSEFARRILCLILGFAMLAGSLAFGIQKFQLTQLYDAYASDSTFIEDHFADPTTVPMRFPKQKRNLIHIYLESMENTYFSKDLGGYMDQNLMPELTKLAKEGVSFSNRPAGQFGGAFSSTGGNWSVASMLNMNTGLPMKVPVSDNSYGSEGNFFPGATALGDILAEQGYEQSVMFGSDADFGGLSYYFSLHGNFNILDYKYAKEHGWIPKDYSVWWGFEDSKLFGFAKEELTRLSETGKPFQFVMETANTHFPDGYLEKGAPARYPSPYANAIAYSSKQVADFVHWIEKQPFYENTTIVIIGDHLSMDKNFFQNIDPNYQRTLYNLILNPAPTVKDTPAQYYNNRSWAVFDMFPTILASIGVEIEGNRLGLGTNLFSGEKTLFEQDGVKSVNQELNNHSNFYDDRILLRSYQPFEGKNITTY